MTSHDPAWAERCATGRVVVVDDDPDILQAFGALLAFEGYAVETHASANAFLAAMQATPEHTTGPACLLCDVQMPVTTGLELQRRLMEWDALPLLLMSGASGAEEVASAFRAGALDFLIKPIETDTLLTAVARALQVSRECQAANASQQQLRERAAGLSVREREVAQLVAQGMTNQAVADQLHISLRTVKLHRSNAMEKLQVSSLADLVRTMDRL